VGFSGGGGFGHEKEPTKKNLTSISGVFKEKVKTQFQKAGLGRKKRTRIP